MTSLRLAAGPGKQAQPWLLAWAHLTLAPPARCSGNHEASDINALFGFRLECLERLGDAQVEAGAAGTSPAAWLLQ